MIIKEYITSVVKNGNWMVRRSDNGKSYDGFQWAAVGEWTEAPDWQPEREYGNGLHGNGRYTVDCYWGKGKDVDFCEIDVNAGVIILDGGKIKCRRAMVLLRNQLPDGLVFGGYLDLSGTYITQLPAGLVVDWLDLSYTKIKNLPNDLAVNHLDVRRTKITTVPARAIIKGKIFPKELRKNVKINF